MTPVTFLHNELQGFVTYQHKTGKNSRYRLFHILYYNKVTLPKFASTSKTNMPDILYINGIGVAPTSTASIPVILRRNSRITEVQGCVSPYTFI